MTDKNREENITSISYKIRFIGSARIIVSELSILVDNLAEEIHKIKHKYGYDDRKCGTCKIKKKDCERFLEYPNQWKMI